MNHIPDFAAWDPPSWTAFASCATALVALVALVFAFIQVLQARTLRRAQAQPYVACYLDAHDQSPHAVYVVIRNFGLTAATNVSITIEPEPKRSPPGNGTKAEAFPYPRRLRTLVPGQEWRTLWDYTHARHKLGLQPEHTAEVSYDGVKGSKRQTYTFSLDWTTGTGKRWIAEKSFTELTQAVESIDHELRGWSERTSGGLSVYTRDGDLEDRRQDAARAEAIERLDPSSTSRPPESDHGEP